MLVEEIVTHSTGAQSKVSGPDIAIEILKSLEEIRKTKRSMQGIKDFCRKQIAKRKSEVSKLSNQRVGYTLLLLSIMIVDFKFNLSTHPRLVFYLTRTS